MNVLAIGAHPDDIELLCAGTLAKYHNKGNKVFMYHTCNGDKGGIDNKPSKQIEEERKFEAEKSAKLIKAEVFGGDFEDGCVYVDNGTRKLMIEAIRRCRADIIITHHPSDYHTDHVNTSRLVSEANFMTTAQNYKTRSEYLEKIPVVYYMDTLAGIDFQPGHYVDITSTIKTKLDMLAMHKSQIEFVKKQHSMDMLEMTETSARYRGFQCGVDYAECFVEEVAWPIGKSDNLLP